MTTANALMRAAIQSAARSLAARSLAAVAAQPANASAEILARTVHANVQVASALLCPAR